jgi:uncharacterized sporulation protein YeaH/YhbH (DUF444 family)
MFPKRAKGGKIGVSIPHLDIPRIVHGDNGQGVGRGPGNKGQVIGKDPSKGKGDGKDKAGNESQDGITIQVDLDTILRMIGEELNLPNMREKDTQTYEDIKIVYKDISRTGPESLRHTRRTLLEAVKRQAMQQTLSDLHYVPGSNVPIRLIQPINSDRRYRQYREIKIPSSNAVLFFLRDCSGSMSEYKCEIVSDMAWWIQQWISRFYEHIDICHIIHDTEAKEVDEKTFYGYREGGGTMASSAFIKVVEMLENKFPPHNYNVYVFYFSDGDNWEDDNQKTYDAVKEGLPPEKVNLLAYTEVCAHDSARGLKAMFEARMARGELNPKYFRSVSVCEEEQSDSLTSDDRDLEIMKGIRAILGKKEDD